jgi:hypothetical protein
MLQSCCTTAALQFTHVKMACQAPRTAFATVRMYLGVYLLFRQRWVLEA